MVRFLFFPSVVTWLILGVLGYQALEEQRADSGRANQSVLEQLSAAVGFEIPYREPDSETPSHAEMTELKKQILEELEKLSNQPPMRNATEAHDLDHEDVETATEPGLLDVLLKSLPFPSKST